MEPIEDCKPNGDQREVSVLRLLAGHRRRAPSPLTLWYVAELLNRRQGGSPSGTGRSIASRTLPKPSAMSHIPPSQRSGPDAHSIESTCEGVEKLQGLEGSVQRVI